MGTASAGKLKRFESDATADTTDPRPDLFYTTRVNVTRPNSVPDSLWTSFTSLGTPFRVDAGQLLWEPGDTREDESYLVVNGLVRLYHPSRGGSAVTLLAVGAGGLLGHHPALQQHPYATGAEALCASQLFVLSAAKVSGWLQEKDDTGRIFVSWLREAVNGQLAETFARLELEHDSAKVRVAHVLLALDRQALLDRMTRQNLADLANLTLETTVRNISQLVREGTLKSSHFTVLSEAERLALAALLEPYEPADLPYT